MTSTSEKTQKWLETRKHDEKIGVCVFCLVEDEQICTKFACGCNAMLCSHCVESIIDCPLCKTTMNCKIDEIDVIKLMTILNLPEEYVEREIIRFLKMWSEKNLIFGNVMLKCMISSSDIVCKCIGKIQKTRPLKSLTSSIFNILAIVVDPENITDDLKKYGVSDLGNDLTQYYSLNYKRYSKLRFKNFKIAHEIILKIF